jgi:hypothetical protein
VSPSSGWYDAGTVVSISATPASGWLFSSWTGSGTGSYSGTNNPVSVTMNGPITETANFVQNIFKIREQPVSSYTGELSVTPQTGYLTYHYDNYGGGALFAVFDRLWLQGKTIVIDWEGSQSLSGNTMGMVGIWDGSYSESLDSDWTNYAVPVTKGAGELYSLVYSSGTSFSRRTDSFVVPSTGTLSSLTLWLDTACGNGGQWTQFNLYSITIKDSSGNILNKWTFNSSTTTVVWEKSGTTTDYGYLGLSGAGMPLAFIGAADNMDLLLVSILAQMPLAVPTMISTGIVLAATKRRLASFRLRFS